MQATLDEISKTAEARIATALPAMLPPTLRPLLSRMVDLPQIRSAISDAGMRLVDELTDDEWRSLLTWIVVETIDLLVPVEGHEAWTLAERAGYELSGLVAVPPTSAIDHVRRILGE